MSKENRFTLSFNLFDYGRTANGNFRRYSVDNVRQIFESAATRERIKLREATGYLGHGRRQIAGKLDLGEVEVVQTPTGALLLENVPACVTVDVQVSDDGTVTHTQELLNTNPGKVVKTLMDANVGGFSWATGGRDGKRVGPTQLTSFHGFDYVMVPGYATNRAQPILESADQVKEDNELIFESLMSAGFEPDMARVYADTFCSPYLLAADLQAREAEILESAAEMERRTVALEKQLSEADQRLKQYRQREDDLRQWARTARVAVPDHVFEAICKGDFAAECAFFESVAQARVRHLGTLPLETFSAPTVKRPAWATDDALYGTAAAAPEFD